MIWTTVFLSTLAGEIDRFRAGAPPLIFRLADPEEVLGTFPPEALAKFEHRTYPESGHVDLRVPEASVGDAMTLAVDSINQIDPGRSWFRWEDLDDEERPGPELLDELVTEVDGVAAIGPGGRIRAFRHTRGAVVEVTVHRRVRAIGTRWREPAEIMAAVEEADAATPMTSRLRFGFGYHEASKFQTQRWLRPVFVFLLDQPRLADGVRWRVAIVEPATTNDELPPDAGLENVVGHCP